MRTRGWRGGCLNDKHRSSSSGARRIPGGTLGSPTCTVGVHEKPVCSGCSVKIEIPVRLARVPIVEVVALSHCDSSHFPGEVPRDYNKSRAQ